MIESKIVNGYDFMKVAKVKFEGKAENIEIELKSILDGMIKDATLKKILLKALNECADEIE